MSHHIDPEYTFSDHYVYKIHTALQLPKITAFSISANPRKKNNIVSSKCERIAHCRVYNHKLPGKKNATWKNNSQKYIAIYKMFTNVNCYLYVAK